MPASKWNRFSTWLRFRLFGRRYVLRYLPNSSGLFFVSHPKPIIPEEQAALDLMMKNVVEEPDKECTITITSWKRP